MADMGPVFTEPHERGQPKVAFAVRASDGALITWARDGDWLIVMHEASDTVMVVIGRMTP